jgi:N-acetylmuramoyl-L-alanine amidase
MKLPDFAFVKIPEGLDITGRCNWVKERRNLLSGIMEFHLDSASPAAAGCTTFFVDGNEWAAGMARKFQMAYTNATGLKGRGIKPDTSTRFGRLGAIRDVPVFALLVELGFISSASDVAIIQKKGLQ